MKKLWISLALCLLLLLAFPLSAFAENTAYVVDGADLLSAEEEASLQSQCEDLKTATGWSVVILTTDTLEGKSPEAYADDYFDYNDYGADGCLFLLSMEDRDWHVSTSGSAIHAITDYTLNTVIPYEIVGSLSSGDYYRAFADFGTLVQRCYSEDQAGDPYDTNNLYVGSDGETIGGSGKKHKDVDDGIFISLICAAVIALIITLCVKSSYKPVRMNPSAADYLVDGSLNVTQQYEHFLYSTVSKTERSSSSSGGGSSTHSGSSGSSHGGGGGKF